LVFKTGVSSGPAPAGSIPVRLGGAVAHIDPVSNQVVATIKVGYAPIGVAATAGAVRVADPVSHTSV
jgi:DNA-binding beta-propeller fold protein YncE